jgi:ectoine hydroxylase-related dioxygenase (phytanoyl-CoA dioxygenase family)
MAALCGDGLRLWRSKYFSKARGSKEVRWHHDKHFQSGDDALVRFDEIGSHFSVLIALSEMGPDSGVLEVIPGSHRPVPGLERDPRPFLQRSMSEHFHTDLPTALIDARVQIPIPRASFLVFHSALLHRSLAHMGGPERRAIAIRLAGQGVDITSAYAEPAHILPFPPPE